MMATTQAASGASLADESEPIRLTESTAPPATTLKPPQGNSSLGSPRSKIFAELRSLLDSRCALDDHRAAHAAHIDDWRSTLGEGFLRDMVYEVHRLNVKDQLTRTLESHTKADGSVNLTAAIEDLLTPKDTYSAYSNISYWSGTRSTGKPVYSFEIHKDESLALTPRTEGCDLTALQQLADGLLEIQEILRPDVPQSSVNTSSKRIPSRSYSLSGEVAFGHTEVQGSSRPDEMGPSCEEPHRTSHEAHSDAPVKGKQVRFLNTERQEDDTVPR